MDNLIVNASACNKVLCEGLFSLRKATLYVIKYDLNRKNNISTFLTEDE